jgi:NAD(P)H-binding
MEGLVRIGFGLGVRERVDEVEVYLTQHPRPTSRACRRSANEDRCERRRFQPQHYLGIGGHRSMSTLPPILVTGAAGQVGGIGGLVVDNLLGRQIPVRAFVRRDDERADALRGAGAEVFVGDLTRTEDIARALNTCRRVYFGMSVSPTYLEAAVGMGGSRVSRATSRCSSTCRK